MNDNLTKEQFIQKVETLSRDVHEETEKTYGTDSKEFSNSKKYKKELDRLIKRFRMGRAEKRRRFDNEAKQRFLHTSRTISDRLQKELEKDRGRNSKEAMKTRKSREKFEDVIMRGHISEVVGK